MGGSILMNMYFRKTISLCLVSIALLCGCIESGKNIIAQETDADSTEISESTTNGAQMDPVIIDCGISHIVVVKEDGSVWAAGINMFYGSLGDGTFTDSANFVRVSGLKDVVSISCGDNFTIALKKDGTVWSWGINSSGQLGDGSFEDKNIPIQIKGLDDVEWIYADADYAYALKNDGSFWAWGDFWQIKNEYDWEKEPEPFQIESFKDMLIVTSAVTFGNLRRDGILFSKVSSFDQSVGYVAEKVIEIDDVKTICDDFILKQDGTVWLWELNEQRLEMKLLQVKGLENVEYLKVASAHTVALTKEGNVFTWGKNEYGQLGRGRSEDVSLWEGYRIGYNLNPQMLDKPKEVKGFQNAIRIAASYTNTAAILEDGTVWYCGDSYEVISDEERASLLTQEDIEQHSLYYFDIYKNQNVPAVIYDSTTGEPFNIYE